MVQGGVGTEEGVVAFSGTVDRLVQSSPGIEEGDAVSLGQWTGWSRAVQV